MEILQTAVSKLKIDFCRKLEIDLIKNNYGIKSCAESVFNSFNSKKLEIIFLSNIDYLHLTCGQIGKLIK